MRHLRAASFVMLAVAVFALLGHICTPWAASAIAHDGGHHHATPHDDGHSDDALHAASCDALRPTLTPAPVVTLDATAAPIVVASVGRADAAPRSIALVSHAPPIYLLHAALLI